MAVTKDHIEKFLVDSLAVHGANPEKLGKELLGEGYDEKDYFIGGLAGINAVNAIRLERAERLLNSIAHFYITGR